MADHSSEAQLEDFPQRFFVKGVVSVNIELADWTTRLDSPGVLIPTWTRNSCRTIRHIAGHCQKLAERVGMSRSIFALKFKSTAVESPTEYLTRWRKLLVGHRLMNCGDPIYVIAGSLDYESESALAKPSKG